MKAKLTLAAAIATGLMCGTAMAQSYSPNPNKAQNSDMRTQSGASPYSGDTYLYLDRGYWSPGTSTYIVPADQSTIWLVPAPVVSEPVAGTRNVYVPNDSTTGPAPGVTTNTPNPNKTQNNGVPTQYDRRFDTPYDTYYIYRIDRDAP